MNRSTIHVGLSVGLKRDPSGPGAVLVARPPWARGCGSAGGVLRAMVGLAFLAVVMAAMGQPTVDFLLTNRIAEPYGVAVDSDNRFYISDSADHRVFRYDSGNGVLTSLAGVSSERGAINGPGFAARFFSPKGLVLARGGLVVADSGNHMLRFLTLTGSVSIVTHFAGAAATAGFVDGPVGSARFNSPIGLAADALGNIYVADSKNNAIRKIDLNNMVSTVATNFAEPAAVAVSDAGVLFVTDTRNHSIKMIEPGGAVRLLAGKGSTSSGTNDSFFAEEALFSSPSGIIWLGSATGLIVSDTGNHTLRRLFYDPVIAGFFPEANGYSVETYAGAPRQSGFQDGLLAAARFNSPVGLARDLDNGLLVADLGNRALRRIQTTPRLPRIENPRIGYVTFVIDDITGSEVSRLVPFTEAVFNNDLILAISPEERTETFFTSGPTPGLFEADTIPVPNSSNSQPAPPYSDGLLRSQVRPTLLEPRPDVTVKAISSAEGRRPSDVVQARIQFKVSTPNIIGDNPASFVLTNETAGAEMWYTLDGSAPTNQAPSIPVATESLSLRITNAVTFRVRAFRRNYKASEIATKVFYPSDFQANRISFGFAVGEASSQFLGSAGQRFIAPVTLSLLPGQKMYSLQFNLTVTNRNGAPAVPPGAFGFQSMLNELLNDGSYRRIEPKMFERYDIEVLTNVVPTGVLITTNFIEIYREAVFTNVTQNLLGVGWFEVVGLTNLYNTVAQDLITYSQAHDRVFRSLGGKVIAGGYSFQIPAAAGNGSKYRIEVGRASGIENQLGKDVFIDAPRDGSVGGGTLNAIKEVAVVPGGLGAGELHYVAGDVAPFRWYNAGDFGDASILNNDVYQIFQAATYGFNVPPSGTDFFDAMDTCCNSSNGPALNSVFDGSEIQIDSITHGDGVLNVTDAYVAFRRSLDPSLKWFARYWRNGTREAAEIPNQFRGGLNNRVAEPPAGNLEFVRRSVAGGGSAAAPGVTFNVEDQTAIPGQTVRIPVRALVTGPYPLRVLMLNVTVEPIDRAAPIQEPILVTPAAGLGKAAFTSSAAAGNYAAAWLDHRIAGFSGGQVLATIEFKVPEQPFTQATYRIRLDHASASPNGLSLFSSESVHGLVSAQSHVGSSFNDGIPDAWRLRYFGSLRNQLAQADADADGDQSPNWAEFRAGTDPANFLSQLKVQARRGERALALRWPSVRGKTYRVESANLLAPAGWSAVSGSLAGTGAELQFDVQEYTSTAQFFRVQLVEP